MYNIIDGKVKDVIDIIKNMDLKNKLRLGVCMSSSVYTNLKYNKAHIHSIFDKRLKEIDNEYLTSYINMRKYPTILFVMAEIMAMNSIEQNQIAMYVINAILIYSTKLILQHYAFVRFAILCKLWYTILIEAILLFFPRCGAFKNHYF